MKNKTERFPGRASFLRYELKGSTGFFIASMLLSAFVTLADLINPRIISCVIDYVLSELPLPESGIESELIRLFGGPAYIRERLYIPALLVIFAALIGAAARYAQSITNTAGAERLVKRMRNTLFSHVDRLSVKWYGENSTGDILQRCTSDVETVKQFVSSKLTSFIRIIMLIALSMFFMSGIDLTLALIAAAFIPVIVGYSMYFHTRIGNIFMKADVQEGVVSSIVQENLTGIRVVRAFGKEAYECDRFISENSDYTNMWIRMMRLMSFFWSAGDLISGLQVMIVVIMGAVYCVNGVITPGNYVAFISYNAMLIWPVRELGRTIADLSRAGVSMDRIRAILNARKEDLSDEPASFGDVQEPLIEFSDVSYTYNGSTYALRNIDLHINKGEKIGIIGGTGSGKSTLADLMTRMCGGQGLTGNITYRGKDITEYPLAAYRRQFSSVLQEPFLFSGTISDNIGIAVEDISPERIRSAAEKAALLPAIEKFTDGFDTFVGERGVTLSGGQKQRCAIAAALARDCEVLILDDAFSALDAQTEAQVRKNIFAELDGRTAVIISHRISTIAGCDRIYVLDGGRICAHGTHQSLISQEGIYRDIYELQK